MVNNDNREGERIMDFYKRRKVVLGKIKDYLERREEAVERKLNPEPFQDFQRKLMLEYGVTENMIKKLVETLVPKGTVKEGELVKKNG